MSRPITQTRPPSRVVDPEGPLELRAPRVQDAPALVDAIADSLDALKRFMPFGHAPQTIDVQYARLTGLIGSYWRGEDYTWHLRDPADPERLLGCIGLHRRAMNPRALEVGYWIRSGADGRGLCTRAVRAIAVLAFEHFDCVRVQCGYDINNGASARVAEKAGFVVEGDLTDYGPAGDDAMRADGWACAGVNRMTALGPDRARAQPWYGPAVRRLRFYDWMGRPVG